MAEKKTLEQILSDAKAGLTGEWEKDNEFLQGIVLKNLTHKEAVGIVRGIGEILDSIMPDDVRADYSRRLGLDNK